MNYNAISSEDLETIMMCKRILQIEAVGTAVDRLPDFGQNGKRPDSPRAEWPRELKYLDLRNTPLTNGFYPPEASSSLETKPGNTIIGAAGKTESPPPPGQTSNGPSASADADKDRYPKDPFSLKEWKEDETWRRKLPREVRERREEYEDLVKRWSRGRVKVLDGRRGW